MVVVKGFLVRNLLFFHLKILNQKNITVYQGLLIAHPISLLYKYLILLRVSDLIK